MLRRSSLPGLSDPSYLRTQQYKNASNLNARVRLHAQFSGNKQGWQRWLFEQLHLPALCHVLELGCGPGHLWRDNSERIAPGWNLLLTDFSAGMVEQAQSYLGVMPHVSFAVADAQCIPAPDAAFGAVLANHMLYHVPDRARALADIRRVLRPGGRLFAATVGETHMRELADLVRGFDPDMAHTGIGLGEAYVPFSLQNGGEQLARHFDHVEVRRYEDGLAVTEAAPLVDYILSGATNEQATAQRREALLTYVQRLLDTQGVLRITKDTGVFVAW
jgi:SAM-dependent methyltransferase